MRSPQTARRLRTGFFWAVAAAPTGGSTILATPGKRSVLTATDPRPFWVAPPCDRIRSPAVILHPDEPLSLRYRLGLLYVRRRARVSWTLALLTLLTLLAMLHRVHRDGIPVDFTPQALFIDKGEEIERLRQFEDTFGREDNTILFLLSDLPHTSEGVDALHTLHETLEAHPDVEEVVSPVGATVLVDENGSLRAVDPLAERPATEAWSLLASSVATRKLLVSDNADTVALRVRLSPNLDRVADLAPRVHAVTQTAAGVSLPSPAILEPTGVPFVRTEITGKLVEDQTLFVPMVGVLFAVTIIALFRRLFLGMAPLLAVGLADIWTLGILIGGGATLNVLSILVPTLVLVIGIADGIHITARYREELDAGHAPDHAMGLTIEAMALPCFLTTFTTGAGFISLWVADTAVIRNFGTHCSIAMAVTFVGILTLLPTLLAWIPVDRVRSSSHGQAPTHRTLRTIDRMVARRPAMVLLGCFLVSGLAATLGVAVEANSRLLEMYREDAPTYQAIKKSEARLTGVIPMFYVLEADIDDAWKDPHKLAQLDTLEQAVSAEPDVLWATSLASYTHELHALLSDGSTRLPNSREAIAQELLIGELAGSAMPPNLLSEDGRQVRVMFLVADSGGRALLPMRDRLDAIAASLFTDLTTTPRLSGDGMLAAAGIDRLINDLLSSLSLMFLVILGTLSILLRDLRLALVACVPNAIPLVFTLGTLGWMGADLGVTNVVSFTVAVGLAVDDTIHFIVRFQAERQRTPDLGAAVTATFLGAGHPIILTSVLLVAGFFVLSLSELTSTRHFGILSSVTMIAALVGDLLFLPALLHLGRRWLAGTPSKP